MKKALILIVSSIIAAGMLVSCKPEEKGGEDAAKVEITSDAKINVPVDGNTYKVAFNATVAWKATLSEGADAFAALTPSSGDAGDAEITLQVRANRGGEERAFTLTITAGTASGVVEFTQEAAATANVKVEALTAAAEGETLELPVESNVRCAIEADVEWIKISAPKAVTEVKYVVDVLPNPTLEQRTGNITVSPEGLEDIIEDRVGIHAMTAEDPMLAVAIGTGMYIEYLSRDKTIAFPNSAESMTSKPRSMVIRSPLYSLQTKPSRPAASTSRLPLRTLTKRVFLQ